MVLARSATPVAQQTASKTVRLWILETDHGTKRTWKATEGQARRQVAARGHKLLSIRPGTEADGLEMNRPASRLARKKT